MCLAFRASILGGKCSLLGGSVFSKQGSNEWCGGWVSLQQSSKQEKKDGELFMELTFRPCHSPLLSEL